jgi:hypothetical protein
MIGAWHLENPHSIVMFASRTAITTKNRSVERRRAFMAEAIGQGHRADVAHCGIRRIS